MSLTRTIAALATAGLLVACGAPEPTASELTAKGVSNLRSAKAAHFAGTGSIALKAQNGLSFSFDFKLVGDAEPPDKARMRVQMALLGMTFDVETITVGGRQYTKDGVSGTWSEASEASPVSGLLDPLGNIDMSLIRDVVEVDRPEVDGRKTRHLRYQADVSKMLGSLRTASGDSSQSISNAQGIGELWIRIDDSQIVRQLVKVSFDVDGLAGLDIPGLTADLGKASVELSLDMRYSDHGQAIPQISAPPVAP